MKALIVLLILAAPVSAWAAAAYTDHTFTGTTLINCCRDDNADLDCDGADGDTTGTNVCEDGDWTPAISCTTKSTPGFVMQEGSDTNGSAQTTADIYGCVDPCAVTATVAATTGNVNYVSLGEALRGTSPAGLGCCVNISTLFNGGQLDGTTLSPATMFLNGLAGLSYTAVLDCTNGGQTGCDATRIYASCIE